MILPGRPAPLGADFDGEGVNFAVYASRAERVDLCLFDASGRESARHRLQAGNDGSWHGYLAGCGTGQRYGYRVFGDWDPARGLRHNPAKLLVDPWARALSGEFRWSPAVFDFEAGDQGWRINKSDSAAFVPRSVVASARAPARRGPRIPWPETIVYEANVRGYTMRHPELRDSERGRFRGMSNGRILAYLKALGVTTVELMPVAEFIDEAFLVTRGLRNYWGYNTISFFAPAGRYAGDDAVGEFREMVDAIHDAGLEVLLDVAYNHTGESDTLGPSVSFRGLDNLCYYRTVPGDPGSYVNDTGCGNTVDTEHPRVRELVLASLRYWSGDMGVDGFRFDLATIMGRTARRYSTSHPLFAAIEADPDLSRLKFIAEPWDPGPGGYQLGNFPPCWAEWNDRYRDSLRRYWRGDRGEAAEFARRLHGSSDIFEGSGRGPWASINFATAHDGFTLADLVSYEHRHNEANGEQNRDGHAHNYSCNHGFEGPTPDASIAEMRRRHRLCLLATLLLSEGTPMLLAGDEFGHTQQGNNNAYAQDNEIGWPDWSGLAADPDFTETVRALIRLRRQLPLFRQGRYVHGSDLGDGLRDIAWVRPDGLPMETADWAEAGPFCVSRAARNGGSVAALALLLNPGRQTVQFIPPAPPAGQDWHLDASSPEGCGRSGGLAWSVPGLSVVCLVSAPPA
ncbi:MAG: glycogen debranching protein GlgX [Gammaproteobacteria bacterium]|nr:glycogen debranching protein GlgX [Gammaproteobacteria bacterium]MDH4253927.1 glycogen debranching protein GlgX [Gammaproteobacteria bacterium]MDH5309352.1 glycogen debranching protein GlgX [Gammaproteobacteria bacterium]